MNPNVKKKVDDLKEGKVIISKEPGNSLMPKLASREPVILTPITNYMSEVELGDICFVKVHGICITHLVYGKDQNKGILVGNIHKHMNGWTKNIYGLAHIVPKEFQTSSEKLEEYRKKIEKEYLGTKSKKDKETRIFELKRELGQLDKRREEIRKEIESLKNDYE